RISDLLVSPPPILLRRFRSEKPWCSHSFTWWVVQYELGSPSRNYCPRRGRAAFVSERRGAKRRAGRLRLRLGTVGLADAKTCHCPQPSPARLTLPPPILSREIQIGSGTSRRTG